MDAPRGHPPVPARPGRAGPARPHVTVVTPEGRIRAERVVLAVNAWAAQYEDIGRRMVTLASDTLLTRPVPDRLAALGWGDEVSVCDARRRLNHVPRWWKRMVSIKATAFRS